MNSIEALLRLERYHFFFLTGDLLNLCPQRLQPATPQKHGDHAGLRYRRSWHFPALSSRSGSYMLAAGALRPSASAAAFPGIGVSSGTVGGLPNTDFTALDGRMNFQLVSAMSILSKRLDLNRPLPDYPAASSGIMSATDPKFLAAQQARQDFARDIFDRLRLITGADDPASVPAGPSSNPSKDALRWLAQLSVNIVDFIDNDDIMTPFPWCAPGGTAEYVYGTELPKLLINEVVVQYKNPTTGPDSTKTLVDVWVELMNPSNQDATLLPDSGGARVSNGSFSPYQVSICTSGSFSTLTNPANPTGAPDSSFAIPTLPTLPNKVQTTLSPGGTTACQVTDFSGVTGGVVLPYNSGAPAGQGFVVLGNSAPLTTTGATGITPTVNSPNLSYKQTPQTTTPLAPTIILQRLACPYTAPSGTNPYVTVDIFQNACNFTSTEGAIANNVANAQTNSDNRPNPFMNHLSGSSNLRGKETTSGSGSIKNSFGSLNFNETGVTNQWLVHLDRVSFEPDGASSCIRVQATRVDAVLWRHVGCADGPIQPSRTLV